MKKATLKERQEQLRIWTNNFESTKRSELITNRPNVVFTDEQLKDGEYYWRIQCEACGYDSTVSMSSRHKCPVCKNDLLAHRISDRHQKLFFEDNDNGWHAVIYDVVYADAHHPNQNINEIKFEDRVRVDLRIQAVLQYHKDYGFLLYAKNYSYMAGYQQIMNFVSPSTNRYNDIIRNFQNRKDDSVNMNLKIATAMEEWKATQEKALKNNTLSKAQASELEYMRYQPKELDLDELLKFPKVMLFDRYNQTPNGMVYAVHCTSCGNTFFWEANEAVKCPHCEAENEMLGKHRVTYHAPTKTNENITFFHYENTGLSGDELLLRVFTANYQLRSNGVVETKIVESKRYFLGRQKKAFDIKDGQMIKAKAEFPNMPYYYKQITAHTKEELCDIFSKSALKYSGAMEAMGCCESAHKPIADINSLTYLRAWYQNPGIEYVFKSSLRTLTYDFLKGGGLSKLPKNKTNVRDVLDLTNMGVQIMRHYDLGIESLDSVRDICNNDPTMTVEGFDQLQNNINLVKAADIIKEHHIAWKEIVDYIDDVYMHQCIEKDDAIEVWYDYLNMATKIGIDISDREKKFPSSLRKEHDIASFAYRSVKSDIDAEEFASQAAINKGNYAYEYGDFVAIVPETAEEVVQEAANQHNCLRSYVEAIKSGKTAVAFIRRKSSQKKSYVSVEIRGPVIVQIKGFANSNPRCPELTEFIDNWCKDKELVISCYY